MYLLLVLRVLATLIYSDFINFIFSSMQLYIVNKMENDFYLLLIEFTKAPIKVRSDITRSFNFISLRRCLVYLRSHDEKVSKETADRSFSSERSRNEVDRDGKPTD